MKSRENWSTSISRYQASARKSEPRAWYYCIIQRYAGHGVSMASTRVCPCRNDDFRVSRSASRDQGTEEEVAVGGRLGAKRIYTPVLPGRPRLSTLLTAVVRSLPVPVYSFTFADHPASRPMLLFGARIDLFGKAANGNSYPQSP